MRERKNKSKTIDHGLCEECGAKQIEYCLAFNTGLKFVLSRLYDFKNEDNKLSDLGLGFSPRVNASKLKWWGLAFAVENDDSRVKKGWWRVTQKGIDFVEGRISIPKYVNHLNNQLTGFSGPQIHFNDKMDGPSYHIDFRTQAREQLNTKDENWEHTGIRN